MGLFRKMFYENERLRSPVATKGKTSLRAKTKIPEKNVYS